MREPTKLEEIFAKLVRWLIIAGVAEYPSDAAFRWVRNVAWGVMCFLATAIIVILAFGVLQVIFLTTFRDQNDPVLNLLLAVTLNIAFLLLPPVLVSMKPARYLYWCAAESTLQEIAARYNLCPPGMGILSTKAFLHGQQHTRLEGSPSSWEDAASKLFSARLSSHLRRRGAAQGLAIAGLWFLGATITLLVVVAFVIFSVTLDYSLWEWASLVILTFAAICNFSVIFGILLAEWLKNRL